MQQRLGWKFETNVALVESAKQYQRTEKSGYVYGS